MKQWMKKGAGVAMRAFHSVALAMVAAVVLVAGNVFAAGGGGVVAADPNKHFDPKGKMPSKYTVEMQKKLRASLPFEDKQDFEEQKKGFIAAPPYKQIKAEAGHVAWDMGSYEFLLQGKDFDSIHPSLQRQAILNMNYGLYLETLKSGKGYGNEKF